MSIPRIWGLFVPRHSHPLLTNAGDTGVQKARSPGTQMVSSENPR